LFLILRLVWYDKGVNFVEAPKKQYWGGYAAIFADPDENLFYLVQRED